VPQDFDPYYKWLAIPPKHQPPNHYRLLGLELFEDDPDVISDAAQQRMAHVRSYQLGQYMALSQQILNELAAAKVCLLDPQKKAEYDRQLRAAIQSKAASQPVAKTLLPPSIITELAQEPVDFGAALISYKKRKKYPRWTLVVASVVVVLLIGIVVASMNRSISEPSQEVAVKPIEAPKPPPPKVEPKPELEKPKPTAPKAPKEEDKPKSQPMPIFTPEPEPEPEKPKVTVPENPKEEAKPESQPESKSTPETKAEPTPEEPTKKPPSLQRPRKVTYAFSNRKAVLRDFDMQGHWDARSNGLLFRDGPPSKATSKAVFSYPISIEYQMYFPPDHPFDIFPGFADIRFCYACYSNTRTTLHLGRRAIELPHEKAIANHLYRIVFSVDQERTLVIQMDGKVVVRQRLDEQVSLKGPIVIDGGFGHVGCKTVVVSTGPSAERIKLEKALAEAAKKPRISFTQVDFSNQANYSWLPDYLPGAPKGMVMLGGIPFNIKSNAGGNQGWSAEFAGNDQDGHKSIAIPVNVYGVTDVYTLINTIYGQPGPTAYAWLEFTGSGGSTYTYRLVGNVDIRDYCKGSLTNTVDGRKAVNVFSCPKTNNGDVGRLDMQHIVLPNEFADQTLKTIKLVDNGKWGFQRVVLDGVTVAVAPKMSKQRNRQGSHSR
jgi:hypothetical protein